MTDVCRPPPLLRLNWTRLQILLLAGGSVAVVVTITAAVADCDAQILALEPIEGMQIRSIEPDAAPYSKPNRTKRGDKNLPC